MPRANQGKYTACQIFRMGRVAQETLLAMDGVERCVTLKLDY